MKILLVMLTLLVISEAKKGKDDLYSYSSVTAVFFPEEAGTNSLCRALDCQDGHLCVVYHDDRAVCMTEKSWKKLMASKRADTRKKQMGSSAKRIPSFQNDCQPCPVVHPVFVCGSDNITYSSECRLKFKNCEDGTSVTVACQGRCPCAASDELMHEPLSEGPTVVEKSSALSRKTVKKQMALETGESDNHVGIDDKKQVGTAESVKAKKQCARKEMRELRRRLVAWFWVIFREKVPTGEPLDHTQQPVCSRGASPGILSWMFSYFDDNKDGSLTLTELFDLEADKYEHCINPFLAHCDANDDLEVSGHEWCRCLQKH